VAEGPEWGVSIWRGSRIWSWCPGSRRLRPEEAIFEAMLRGWRAQLSRGLKEETIADREAAIRRFLAFTNEFPWTWLPGHVEERTTTRISEARRAASTVRATTPVCGCSAST
jgi:integrase/recombinase XerC